MCKSYFEGLAEFILFYAEFILLLCYSKFHHIFRIHLQHSVALAFVVLLMDIELRYGGKFAFSS